MSFLENTRNVSGACHTSRIIFICVIPEIFQWKIRRLPIIFLRSRFYQVNPVQTEKLYSTALEYAKLTGKESVWDLYCGIGTISLFLSQKAKQVYGVEIVPQAIEDAKTNAALNGITNAEFFLGKAEEVLPQFYNSDDLDAGMRIRM